MEVIPFLMIFLDVPQELGTRFAAVGMCEQAVQCFLKVMIGIYMQGKLNNYIWLQISKVHLPYLNNPLPLPSMSQMCMYRG